MSFSKTAVIAFAIFAINCYLIEVSQAFPSIQHYDKRYESVDYVQVCLNNCAQCKIMFGDFFQGQVCGESCLEMKGKLIPDCQKYDTISAFIKAVHDD